MHYVYRSVCRDWSVYHLNDFFIYDVQISHLLSSSEISLDGGTVWWTDIATSFLNLLQNPDVRTCKISFALRPNFCICSWLSIYSLSLSNSSYNLKVYIFLSSKQRPVLLCLLSPIYFSCPMERFRFVFEPFLASTM